MAGGSAAAEVSFNYLGQLDQALPRTGSALRGGARVGGPGAAARGSRGRTCWRSTRRCVGGRLQLGLTYSGDLPRAGDGRGAWPARFLEALRALIAHCLSPGGRRLHAVRLPAGRGSSQAAARPCWRAGRRRSRTSTRWRRCSRGCCSTRSTSRTSGVYVEQIDLHARAASSIAGLPRGPGRRWWRGTRSCARRSSGTGLDEPLQVVFGRPSSPVA